MLAHLAECSQKSEPAEDCRVRLAPYISPGSGYAKKIFRQIQLKWGIKKTQRSHPVPVFLRIYL